MCWGRGVPSGGHGCPVPGGRVALAGVRFQFPGKNPACGLGALTLGGGGSPRGAHPVGCPLTAALGGTRGVWGLRGPLLQVSGPPPPDLERLR